MGNEQEQMQQCLAELRNIENVILPQLDELAQKIGANFKYYADLVRDLGKMTVTVGSFSSETNAKIGSAAALVSRGIEGYGAYKAAKEHNKRLDEMMAMKRSVAWQKRKQIADWLPRICENVAKSERLCKAPFEKEYPLDSVSDALVSLQLKVLNLYRTNLFYKALAEWMMKEYLSWQNGHQTCGEPMPTLLTVNTDIGKSIGGDNLYRHYQDVLESGKSIAGKDIALLADPQLTVMALDGDEDGDLSCVDIRPDHAHASIAKILRGNEGVKFYGDRVTELCKSMNYNPASAWNCIALVFAVVFFVVLYACRDTLGTGAFLTTLIIGEACVLRVWSRRRKKIYMVYLEETTELLRDAGLAVLRYCGHVEQEEVDYEKKSAVSAAANGLLGLK